MSEEFYDAEIAPKLAELGKLCQDRGLSFLAVVEYAPDEIGRTVAIAKDSTWAFRLTETAARCNGNFDALAFAVKRHADAQGNHSSIVLQLMTPPTFSGSGGDNRT